MFHKLLDHRVNCVSALVEMRVGDYIELVEQVYNKEGGIEGQRGPLKTKTAITIRTRLVSDIKSGAVMPPVVLGVLVSPQDYERLLNASDLATFMDIVDANNSNVSVIDGMQRTTAMLDAIRLMADVSTNMIRVEFWVSVDLNSLIYRMLVLNTGQVPWEIGRQLETVYGQFLNQIRATLGNQVEIFLMNSARRRAQPGQYQSKNVIELLLLFSSRRSELDLKDKVAEDFARLDAIETSAHSEFLNYFIEALRQMARLDQQFSRVVSASSDNTRLKSGKDIFGAFPAMAGFCAALAIELFDEPGFQTDWAAAPYKMAGIVGAVDTVCATMENLNEAALSEFLQLELLEQRLAVRSGQVGRFEREFYRKAFAAMLRNADRLTDMTPCWVA